jgi:ATP-dependent Clp protease ATP-binding subunit ClpA
LSSTCFAKAEFRTETSALPFQLLLGILDNPTLTLGDNSRVDLSQTVIFLTSNLGGAQIADLLQGGMGFVQPADKPTQGLGEQ